MMKMMKSRSVANWLVLLSVALFGSASFLRGILCQLVDSWYAGDYAYFAQPFLVPTIEFPLPDIPEEKP